MEERGKCAACSAITVGYCKQCDIFMCHDCTATEKHHGVFKCRHCGIFHCMTYLMDGNECYQCSITRLVGDLNELAPGVGTIAISALANMVVNKKQ
jgi:hypothetical protein